MCLALPQSLATHLHLEPGERVVAIAEESRVVIQRLQRRVPRLESRPLGIARGDFELPEGWEKPMTDEEVDDFIEGR
ncbi:MAG: hypothetical protein U0Q16_27435 [Bryobacteraceae bacterium]